MKKRRGAVLWRWTWYIAQPGSFRDCSVSFANKPATSDSRPLFAIHVTASTTIACSRFAIAGRLRCDRPHRSLRRPALVLTLCQSSDFLSCQYSQFCNEIIYKNGLLTTRTGGDHANPRRGLCFQEREILASRFWQLVHLGDSLSGSLPSRHPVVNTFDPIIAAGVCRYIFSCLAVDFVTHTNGNFGKLIEDIKLRHHQPGNSVYGPCVTQQRQIKPAGAPGTPSNSAYSLPRARSRSPVESSISLGNGPLPTRVQYALVIPITVSMAVGATPVPVTAPPEVALEEVTKGYVLWSMSSIVPCAPSKTMDSPPANAWFSSAAVSQTKGAIFAEASAYS